MSKEIITIKKETKIRKDWVGNDNTSNDAITSLKKYKLKFRE